MLPAADGGLYKGNPTTLPSSGQALKVAATLEIGAGGDLADFGVFDGAIAKFFDGGLQHGAAEVVAMDIEVGERFQQAANRLNERVEFRDA